jgi:hypothetical protein
MEFNIKKVGENKFAIFTEVEHKEVMLKTNGGLYDFVHNSKEFLEHVIKEVKSFRKNVSLAIDGSIEKPYLSSYSIYSDQLYMTNRHENYHLNMDRNPVYIVGDACTRTVTGPEVVDQIEAYQPLWSYLEKNGIDVGFLNQSETIMDQENLTDLDHERQNFYSAKDWKKIHSMLGILFSLYKELTPFRQGAFHALYCNMGDRSAILPLAYLNGALSREQYLTALAASKCMIPEIWDDADDYEYMVFCDDHRTTLCIIDDYLELGDEEYKQDKQFQSLLSADESKTLEFKTSFRNPYPSMPDKSVDKENQTVFKIGKKTFKSKKDIKKFIEAQSLKTIVGFLNTDGGILIIGVKEQGRKKELVGIEFDEFESSDHFELAVIQAISNRIDKNLCHSHICIAFKSLESKMFCVIEVEPYKPVSGGIPAYLDEIHCYVRSGARTDELEGKDLANFVSNRPLKDIE